MGIKEEKILVTGSEGFIAKNLVIELRNRGCESLFLCNRSTSPEELDRYLSECGTLVHLAGVNRPEKEEDYYTGNVSFTERLLQGLKDKSRKIHIIFSSTIQSGRHKSYEESKRKAEELLQGYARESGSSLTVFCLPNVFGKWCRPEYNSVVATFCHRISRDKEIRIDDPDAEIRLVYIDDVVDGIIRSIETGGHSGEEYGEIPGACRTTVGEVAGILYSFREGRKTLQLPDLGKSLERKLYSTYLSYLEPKDCVYSLKMNTDERGSFTEFLRLGNAGQVSVNVAKPGIVKGNHWHHTKVEKFLVVRGRASICLRHMATGERVEHVVSGEKLEVVDIPAGYTHNITNIGTEDLVTVIWANEAFDPERPDTYFEKV